MLPSGTFIELEGIDIDVFSLGSYASPDRNQAFPKGVVGGIVHHLDELGFEHSQLKV